MICGRATIALAQAVLLTASSLAIAGMILYVLGALFSWIDTP